MPYYSTDRFFAQAWHLRPYEDVPLPVAIELAEVVTEACRWFHDPKSLFLGDPSAPPMADEVVDDVCQALQHQLDKEGESRTRGATCSRHGVPHTRWYHLMELPPARRRALVERVWALKERHAITVRVWNQGDAPPATPQPPYGPHDGLWP
jgi:hypothetical protein